MTLLPRSKSPKSLRQFNSGIFIFAGLIIFIVVIKKFQTSHSGIYGDLRLRSKEEVSQAFARMEQSLSEVELAELDNLIKKGMRMLPVAEREKLQKLQEKYAYGGGKHFSEDDVITMRQLNYKGINLLSEEDQSQFYYLMRKGIGRISGN